MFDGHFQLGKDVTRRHDKIHLILQQIEDVELRIDEFVVVDLAHLRIGVEAFDVRFRIDCRGVEQLFVIVVIVNRHADLRHMQNGSAAELGRNVQTLEQFVEASLVGEVLDGKETVAEVIRQTEPDVWNIRAGRVFLEGIGGIGC